MGGEADPGVAVEDAFVEVEGGVLFFFEERVAADGEVLLHELVVVFVLGPEHGGTFVHFGFVGEIELVGGVFAVGIVEIGEHGFPFAPEFLVGGPVVDGAVDAGTEIGSAHGGAEQAVAVEDGADDFDVGVGGTEVLDDFVEPFEELASAVLAQGTGGGFSVVEDDLGGTAFVVGDAAELGGGAVGVYADRARCGARVREF